MSLAKKCDCGGDVVFEPTATGTTCGGLDVTGADVCQVCGTIMLSKASHATAEPERWTLATSGRSIDAGGSRLRAEAGPDVARLMKRILRLPDLERALRAIAAGAADPRQLATDALADGAEEEAPAALIAHTEPSP